MAGEARAAVGSGRAFRRRVGQGGGGRLRDAGPTPLGKAVKGSAVKDAAATMEAAKGAAVKDAAVTGAPVKGSSCEGRGRWSAPAEGEPPAAGLRSRLARVLFSSGPAAKPPLGAEHLPQPTSVLDPSAASIVGRQVRREPHRHDTAIPAASPPAFPRGAPPSAPLAAPARLLLVAAPSNRPSRRVWGGLGWGALRCWTRPRRVGD